MRGSKAQTRISLACSPTLRNERKEKTTSVDVRKSGSRIIQEIAKTPSKRKTTCQ
ncbi:hypothetical protein L873DRAFT_1796928 [Choiromyces venosus 120613-1]|uniref:Uncharacterized protein n=1 Tax=Choiromyces venosus 120613-1 TaxID=1336337 RepID=A0A3N4J312_9PEZI|nr:hypothetical protein L873DRAFT_1817436 [Choiromyces venosus 120613-1]RPB06021.1 hypothetical protein L873DRAFT_1796928 [Choiromyces venosus 120613-1]